MKQFAFAATITFLLFFTLLPNMVLADDPAWKINAKWSRENDGIPGFQCIDWIIANTVNINAFQPRNWLVQEAVKFAQSGQYEAAIYCMMLTQCHRSSDEDWADENSPLNTFYNHRDELFEWLKQGAPD